MGDGGAAYYIDPFVNVGQFIAVLGEDSESICGGYRIVWVMHQRRKCVIYEAEWEGLEPHYAFPGQKFVFKWAYPWVDLGGVSREMELLSQFQDYEEFVPLLDVSPLAGSVGFFMPLADPGDLRGYLFGSETQQSHLLSEEDACQLAQDLALAIRRMHGEGVVHADIKLENCLLTNPVMPGQPRRLRLQICDFGCARNCTAEERLCGPAGTAYYQPPELLDFNAFGQKMDIFCFGVVVYVMLAHSWPFPGHVDVHADAVRAGAFDVATLEHAGVSASALNVVAHCLDPVEERRFGAEELCDHEWFQMLSSWD